MSTHLNDPEVERTPPSDDVAAADDNTNVVEIAPFRASRYERHSRSLPHLADDPDWTPATFDLPRPIVDDTPRRWFDRFRR